MFNSIIIYESRAFNWYFAIFFDIVYDICSELKKVKIIIFRIAYYIIRILDVCKCNNNSTIFRNSV